MAVADIKLLLLDVDGVLTDGSIWLDDEGRQMKRFHVRDGAGIRAWQRCGLQVGILTARSSRAVTYRMQELGVTLISQGASDKQQGFEDICSRVGLTADQVAYVGDDLMDLPVLCRVGYPIAVADAANEVRQVAKYVCNRRGGSGAVREVIEHLLKTMERWDEVLDAYGL